jgi:hypothetical protein
MTVYFEDFTLKHNSLKARRSGGEAIDILDRGSGWREIASCFGRVTPCKEPPTFHCVVGWMVTRVGFNVVATEKIPPTARNRKAGVFSVAC